MDMGYGARATVPQLVPPFLSGVTMACHLMSGAGVTLVTPLGYGMGISFDGHTF